MDFPLENVALEIDMKPLLGWLLVRWTSVTLIAE